MEEQRYRGAKYFAQGHCTSKWQSCNLNPGSLFPELYS